MASYIAISNHPSRNQANLTSRPPIWDVTRLSRMGLEPLQDFFPGLSTLFLSKWGKFASSVSLSPRVDLGADLGAVAFGGNLPSRRFT